MDSSIKFYYPNLRGNQREWKREVSVTETEQSGKFRLKRRDIAAFSCILILIFSVLVLQGRITYVQTEFLGSYTMTPWVPFAMLYDPPGNGSYAQFKSDSVSGFMMRFEGETSNIQMTGEFVSRVGFGYSTSVSGNGNILIMIHLNQTWELVRYTFLGNTRIDANLTHCSILGDGAFLFSEAETHDVWINDLTNTTSDYSIFFNVEAGETETVTVESGGNTPRSIGAGYNINLMGLLVPINVLLNPQDNNPFTISYEFSNGADSLSFNMFSDAPITQNPYKTDGILIWFV